MTTGYEGLNPLELALYLDSSPAWTENAIVRCARGCTIVKAWAMPSGQVVTLINLATYRVSEQWRAEGAALADSPFIAMASDTPRSAVIWDDEPRTVILATCRHAQKVPLRVSAVEVWEAARKARPQIVTVNIPPAAKVSRAQQERTRSGILATYVSDATRRGEPY